MANNGIGPRAFDVLGVVDLRRGLAVRARGGQRHQYLPIDAVAGERIPPGDAIALTRQYVDRFGLSTLYVADLDALEHHTPQHMAVQRIASDVTVWLDAAMTSWADAQRALASGASRLIVGLETLPSFEVLASIVNAVGRQRVVFSLDLRDGQPIATTPTLARQTPEDLAARAADAGVGSTLLLDLARVGSGSGLDLDMISRLISRISPVPVYAGGGIRSIADLEHLRGVGCDGALVATALLDGQITKRDLDVYLRPTSYSQ